MTIDTIRAQADAFDRRTRRQDMISLAAFAVVIMANAITAAFERSMTEKIGDLLTIAAALYCVLSYWRVREASPAALGAMPSVEFYRDKILRRQAMMGRFWVVVLLFLPGFILSAVDGLMSPRSTSQYVAMAVGFVGLVVVIEWLNRREARRLSTELDELDREIR